MCSLYLAQGKEFRQVGFVCFSPFPLFEILFRLVNYVIPTWSLVLLRCGNFFTKMLHLEIEIQAWG
jgi:hypothetical protein